MKRPMEDDYESSEEENPTQIPCKKQATQASQATSQRFRWQAEMIERLLKNIANLKAVYKFKRIDFESDLTKVYRKIQKLMAEEFGAFGPVEEPPIDDGLSTEEISKARAQNINDKKQITIGYERVKQKVKDIRQDDRKAVTKGRRSGSRKLVGDNWDLLKKSGGGSPAVTL